MQWKELLERCLYFFLLLEKPALIHCGCVCVCVARGGRQWRAAATNEMEWKNGIKIFSSVVGAVILLIRKSHIKYLAYGILCWWCADYTVSTVSESFAQTMPNSSVAVSFTTSLIWSTQTQWDFRVSYFIRSIKSTTICTVLNWCCYLRVYFKSIDMTRFARVSVFQHATHAADTKANKTNMNYWNVKPNFERQQQRRRRRRLHTCVYVWRWLDSLDIHNLQFLYI